jgi:hypothetical protein
MAENELTPETKAQLELVRGESTTPCAADLTDAELQNLHVTQFTPTAKRYTSQELLAADLPAPKWIIPDLLPEGLTLLVGKPKSGKSWLSLQIAASLSLGHDVISHFPCNPTSVFYISLEESDFLVKDRFEKKIGGMGSPDHLTFLFDCAVETAGVKFIEAEINCAAVPPKLIIIDTLRRFMPSFDVNSYDETTSALQGLRALAAKHEISILALCHARKSASADAIQDTILGSTGFAAGSDTFMIVTKNPGRPTDERPLRGYVYTDSRIVMQSEYAIELVKDRGWRYVGEGEQVRKSDIQQAIISALKEAQEKMTPKDIADETNIDHGIVKTTCRRLFRNGDIKQISRGFYASYE